VLNIGASHILYIQPFSIGFHGSPVKEEFLFMKLDLAEEERIFKQICMINIFQMGGILE
jgi:hypothetical protein